MSFSWTPHRFAGGALALDVVNSVVLRHDATRRIDRFAVRDQMQSFPRAAAEFCAERALFGELVEGMTSGPTIVQVLEGEGAILKNREIMGATNPANADEGTIRKVHALSIGENSVHGSDAPETAAQEIKYWFSDTEIVG
ncbi:nucleoside-diphosphate kinase [Rhizobium ruizarguesonis]